MLWCASAHLMPFGRVRDFTRWIHRVSHNESIMKQTGPSYSLPYPLSPSVSSLCCVDEGVRTSRVTQERGPPPLCEEGPPGKKKTRCFIGPDNATETSGAGSASTRN